MVILGFEGAGTAEGVWESIAEQQKQGAVEIEDAVIAYRPTDGVAAKAHKAKSIEQERKLRKTLAKEEHGTSG
jgi:uncharacterized membrane protein